MYETNENKIEWGSILKKVLIILVVVLIIFGIITLITKCTKSKDDDAPTPVQVDLSKQLDELEEAALKYLSSDNLPTELNASKTIRLKILIGKELLTNIYDSENNICDTDNSYAEVTRLENNYAVKLNLTCGMNNAYRIIYVGCFEECSGEICEGSEDSTGGVCNVISTPIEEPDSPSDESSTNSSNQSTNKTSSSQTTTPTNSNSNNNSSSTNKVTYYEYQSCSTSYTCPNNTKPNSKNQCVTNKYVELTVPYAVGSISYTKCYTAPQTNSEFFTYIPIKYDSTCSGYKYEVIQKTITCEDPKYTYYADLDKCIKRELQTFTTAAKASTTCVTQWSTATNLPGWTKTGNTK